MHITKTVLVAAALFTVFSAPARADSFSIRFSDGDNHYRGWDRGHDRGHGWKHGHHKKHWKHHGYWPQHSAFYNPYPMQQVVYYQQPPVQQVIFANNAPSFQNDNGQYCREYQSLVFVGGKKQSGYGTACYMPDGSWKVVD